ncbi:MAG: S-layer homology domain-containing protein [Clostridia bacterium]|nr:S-layer homology domain-containing protein [Clostridia bacterium]
MLNNFRKKARKAAIFSLVLAQIGTVGIMMPSTTVSATKITRQVENLDRGVVAIKTDNGVFVSWRRLGTESPDTKFSLYRDNVLVTSGAITNYVDPNGTKDSKYMVVTNDKTQSKPVSVWDKQYLEIPLQDTPTSSEVDVYTLTYATYYPGDSAVGDLDGDGQYEIVMIWEPGNAKDAATAGATDKVYIDAYKLDGTRLWRIDMGKNIRAGAHDTQLMVADFNSDGKAELVVRTADGTVAGDGTVIGDGTKDWASLNSGKNLQGPLYLTAFEGATGKVISTVPFDPQTENSGAEFGDGYGNRSERYLATMAYLDGVHPSVIEQRGYYPGKDTGPGRTVISAYDLKDNKLVQRWRFDTKDSGNSVYIGQGNHSMTAGDVDGDGYDEVISGALALDNDGKVLWCSGYGHGDAHHLGDFDPTHEGLEYMKVYESVSATPFDGGTVHEVVDVAGDGSTIKVAQYFGQTLQDAKTGKILQSHDGIKDTGRGMIANIGYKDKYFVMWGAGSSGYWDNEGNKLPDLGLSMNGRIYWDGGLTDQLQDGVNIAKWNNSTNKMETIFTADGNSINGTKANLNAQADIFGDWREEMVTYKQTGSKEETVNVYIESAKKEYPVKKVTPQYALRIYTTVIPTQYNFSTFMHDDLYRIGAATYNVAYNQPPHISFYLSDTIDGYKTQPTPNVTLVPNNFKEDAFDSSKVSGSGESPAVTSSPSGSGGFTDIGGHWAESVIMEMYNAGVINGMDATTFAPDAQITRAQFIKLVVATLGLDISAPYSGPCTDVAGHWSASYVQAAEAANIIDANLETGNVLDPDKNITREEMASLVTRAASVKGLDVSGGSIDGFTDKADISDWASNDVAGAVKLGIVNGMTDGSFAPKAEATRAQAAAMMSRLLAKIK